MGLYASDTDVSVEKSKAEIEKLLMKYGADQFMSGWEKDGCAMIAFRCSGRHVKFLLPLPRQDEYKMTPGGKRERNPADIYRAWEQGCRQRWRALCIVIKAKLEAVECGISEFEDEFLSHIVLPNGKQVRDWLRPQLALVYESGKMPNNLPGLPSPK